MVARRAAAGMVVALLVGLAEAQVWRFSDMDTAMRCGAQPNTMECASKDGVNCLWGRYFPGKKDGDVISDEEVRGKAGGNLVPVVESCPHWTALDGSDPCAKFGCYSEEMAKMRSINITFTLDTLDSSGSSQTKYRYMLAYSASAAWRDLIMPAMNTPGASYTLTLPIYGTPGPRLFLGFWNKYSGDGIRLGSIQFGDFGVLHDPSEFPCELATPCTAEPPCYAEGHMWSIALTTTSTSSTTETSTATTTTTTTTMTVAASANVGVILATVLAGGAGLGVLIMLSLRRHFARQQGQAREPGTIEMPSAGLIDTENVQDGLYDDEHQGSAKDMQGAMSQARRCSLIRNKGLPPGHLLFSGRFDGSEGEKLIRSVYAEIRSRYPNIPAYIVTAKGGQEFGRQTVHGLANMHAMAAFCGSNYGENTTSKYSTYFELKHAYDHDVPVIPIKFCKEWPPHGGNKDGHDQNRFVFKPDLVYLDLYGKSCDPAAVADHVANAYLGLLE